MKTTTTNSLILRKIILFFFFNILMSNSVFLFTNNSTCSRCLKNSLLLCNPILDSLTFNQIIELKKKN